MAISQADVSANGRGPLKVPSKVAVFLERFCRTPDLLLASFEAQPSRVEQYSDGQLICRKGDIGDVMWVILEGDVRVEGPDHYVVVRHPADIVGEGAFYRSVDGPRLRGADLRAAGEVVLYRIDGAFVESLSLEGRAAWHETICRVLTTKLDESQVQRLALRADRLTQDTLLDRFVSAEGKAAARAAISGNDFGEIDPEICDALIWFSDVGGFTNYASDLSPREAGILIREIMEIQSLAVESAAGQIDKYMGDGMMAFWRMPDAQRQARLLPKAVESALDARDQLLALINERSLPIDIRIGLHFGKAIFGDFGGGKRIGFTAIGSTVNTASRYEQAPKCSLGLPLGRVRLSDSVFGLIEDDVLRSRFDRVERKIVDKHGVPYVAFTSLEEQQ